jgi:hypothetical protein
MEEQRETVVTTLHNVAQQLLVGERFEMLVKRHCFGGL